MMCRGRGGGGERGLGGAYCTVHATHNQQASLVLYLKTCNFNMKFSFLLVCAGYVPSTLTCCAQHKLCTRTLYTLHQVHCDVQPHELSFLISL